MVVLFFGAKDSFVYVSMLFFLTFTDKNVTDNSEWFTTDVGFFVGVVVGACGIAVAILLVICSTKLVKFRFRCTVYIFII